MFGRRCTAWQTVFSPVLGRNVTRCASFGGGAGQLGAFPISLEGLKTTGMMAAVGVGGAIFARRASAYLIDLAKLDIASPYLRPALEVGIGVGAGYAIARFAHKEDIGAQVALGPMIVNGMDLAEMLLAPKVGPPVAGYDPALGVAVEQDRLTPGWAQVDPFVAQVGQQFPAWTMG